MGNVFVADFGIKDCVQTYRVNGGKDDLKRLVRECVEMDASFIEWPELKHVHRSEWTVLLKIRVWGYENNNDNSS